MELSLTHAIKAYGRMEAVPCFIFPPPQANKFLISLFLCRGLATLVYSLRRLILDSPRVRKIKEGNLYLMKLNTASGFLRKKLTEIPFLEMCRSGQVLSLLVPRAGLE